MINLTEKKKTLFLAPGKKKKFSIPPKHPGTFFPICSFVFFLKHTKKKRHKKNVLINTHEKKIRILVNPPLLRHFYF